MALWLLILMLLATACVPAQDLTPGVTPPASPREPTQPAPAPAPPTASAALPPAVRVAQAALASRAGVTSGEVRVVAWTRDTFALDDLDCQAETETEPVRPAMVVGHEVTLQIGQDTYVYRVHGRRAVLCRGPE